MRPRGGGACRRDSLRTLLLALLETQVASRDVPILDGLVARRPELRDAAGALLADPALWIDASAVIWSVEQWERASKRVAELIEHPAWLEVIARASRARILREHTWKARGEEMLWRLGDWTGQ